MTGTKAKVKLVGTPPKTLLEVSVKDELLAKKLESLGVFHRSGPGNYVAPYLVPLGSVLAHYVLGEHTEATEEAVAKYELPLVEALGGQEVLASRVTGMERRAFPLLMYAKGVERMVPTIVSLEERKNGPKRVVLTPQDPAILLGVPHSLYEVIPPKGVYMDLDEFVEFFTRGSLFVNHGVFSLLLFPPGFVVEFAKILERKGKSKEVVVDEEDPRLKGLWRHQVEGVRFLLSLKEEGKKGGLLAYDMGTGKTRTALAFASYTGAKRVLAVCPKAVAPSWVREVERWYPDSYDLVLNLVEERDTYAKADALNQALRFPSLFAVVNYDSIIREPLIDVASSVKWDLLILDESHFVKNPESKRFKSLKEIPRDFTLALSGTPMVQGPLDIWSQAYLLDPRFLGSNFYAFRNTYAVMGGYKNKQVVGYRWMDRFRAKLKKFSLSVSIDDVLELPESMDERIEVQLSPLAQRLYNYLYEKFLQEVSLSLDQAKSLAAVYILRMQQLTSGYYHEEGKEPRKVDSQKEEALKDLLLSLPPREPVVVFARFLNDIDDILRVARELDIPASELSGRKNELENFRLGKSRLIAVQIQAGGVGIDLSRSRYAIYYSLGYSYGDYAQSRARIRRPGQERKVIYYHIIARGTIDEAVYRALSQKEDVIEGVISEIKLRT